LFSDHSLVIRAGPVLMLRYIIALIVYRLYISQLSTFPGLKIAAIASMYAVYHDVIRGNR
jgi:hypothetical protein